jgi:hypothetical protein
LDLQKHLVKRRFLSCLRPEFMQGASAGVSPLVSISPSVALAGYVTLTPSVALAISLALCVTLGGFSG